MGDEMSLTPKQKAFADYFLQSGNVTEAARKAGYSEKTAAVIGNENLKKPNVSAYIAERQQQIDDSRIADAAEVLRFYTSVLRGEVKDQFDLDVSVADKMVAGRELMRRYERIEGQKPDTGGIVIVNNIPRPGKE